MSFIERPIGATGFSNAHGVERTFHRTLPEDPEQASMMSLDYIHALARDGREDPIVRRKAFDIIRRAGVTDGRQSTQIIAAIHRWIQKHVFYMHDPSGVEMLTQARVLIGQAERGEAVEDCDTFVLLEHALLNATGVPSRSVIWKADARAPDQWSHITLEAFDSKRGVWVPLDPIMKDKPIGWSPPKFYDKRVVPVGDGPGFPGREAATPTTVRLGPPQTPTQSFKGFFGAGASNQVTWRGFGRYGDQRADEEFILAKIHDRPRFAECHEITDPMVLARTLMIEGAKELDATGKPVPQGHANARTWFSHLEGVFYQQVGAQWPYHEWPPKNVQRAQGLLNQWAHYVGSGSPEPYYGDLGRRLSAEWKQAGLDMVRCAELQRDAGKTLIPYYELGRVFAEIKQLKQMRDELATYIPKLMESMAPLAERGERIMGRIETKQERMALVGEVAKWTGLVLSALGPFTAGITEVLAIAVEVGNLAYQYDRAAAMASGSAAKTLAAVGGGFQALSDYIESIVGVMNRIEAEMDQRAKLIAVLREVHPEYFAPQTPQQVEALAAGEGAPKRNLLPVLAVGGAAAAALIMAVL